ncbi:MAG: M48 family metallopeptidase [Clostridia bacterium]|nr:M48 family metallopeptidase [Clostridia bacterium]
MTREKARMQLKYQVIYSRRKTLGLEIRAGKLIVRAPAGTSRTDIEKLIREKQHWIETHLEKSRERAENAAAVPKLTYEELRALGEQAVKVIPERVRYYAERIGVRPKKITIRNQKTRWGSCSAGGNLNFNCLLMLAPMEVLDSVVVHELCHMKEMNHSERFYREINRVYPEYDRCHRWLKEHGAELMARME